MNSLKDDAEQNDGSAKCSDEQIGMPGRVGIMRHPSGHAKESEHIERREGEGESCHPAPERALAPLLVEHESRGLREPVAVACEEPEKRARDQHVVEVRDEEKAVVNEEVGGRQGHQHACHAAHCEGDEESEHPVHGRGKGHAAPVKGEEPVEDLDPGRNGDQHGGDAEHRIDV